MNEKIIVTSKVDEKKKKICLSIMIGSLSLALISLLITFVSALGSNLGKSFNFIYNPMYFITTYLAMIFGIIGIITLIIFLPLLKNELTVSNYRITGKTKFGKIVDLPVDMISAVSISNMLSKVSISTASGFCNFALVENYREIHQILNSLIMERRTSSATNTKTNVGCADELKKYKDLLDSGIITQEEFDAKKKELLGL